MERQRIEHALARIEAAAARIEAAGARRMALQNTGEDSGLARKHEELRAKVGASLQELDTLIGTLEA
ncbi:hypothetical protein H0274_03610 [Altererythrobacter sp. CC-YST694]|uniref:hypothetical protein n=1 Tax=Altererythrobacter sp. CC-YST694 TaxID=2755038 RepID=UPI001D00DC13|nr:hypothetical protein [Altererythrobacter sp. CC-YST694]MCB5424335.1 hypothetical protein [Altererythrobacter sp. CC-YST694]